MAKAISTRSKVELRTLTDCMYFLNGHCKSDDKCRYRHCREAAAQTKHCFKWPKTCRDVNCPYRHPAPPREALDKPKRPTPERSTTSSTPSSSLMNEGGSISFFWDIENVPIPKGQKPFDIVQRIRRKLVVDAGLRETNFSCYCDSTMISKENQLNLFHANVRIVHIPDRKVGAVDREIMRDLDRFERAHRPPATIVLISGDIDFVGKLCDLRHQAGFHVIVIHNKPAKIELKATVNAHYPWEVFTQPTLPEVSNVASVVPELLTRAPQPYGSNNNTANPSRKEKSSSVVKKPLHSCPACTSEFESLQALRQHQDAKDHLFDCPACDETFVTPDGLTQHMKAKGHQQMTYPCQVCDRHFTTFDSLNQHKQSTGHHGYVGPVASNANGFNREIPTEKKDEFVPDAAMIIIQQGIGALLQHLIRK